MINAPLSSIGAFDKTVYMTTYVYTEYGDY